MTPAANNQQPATSSPPPEAWMAYVTNRWSRTVAQPFLIALMLTAFITGPLTILQITMPDTPWRPFIYIFFLIILETAYTTLWLKRPDQRSLDHLAYRGAEFLVFVILMRLLTWWLTDSWPDLATWKNFLFEPLSFFASGMFILSIIFVFVIWQMTMRITNLFNDLALDRAEAAYYAAAFGKHKLDTRPEITDRGQLVASFLQQWLASGLVLLFFTALATFDLLDPAAGRSLFSIARLPLPQQMLLALIFYFLAGFLLLSQARLALLNARWLINGVQKNERLEKSWYRFGWRLLAIVAVVAAFLPLGSTIALGRIVTAIIQGVVTAVTYIFSLFLGLLMLLFPASEQLAEEMPLEAVDPQMMPPMAPPAEPSEMLRIVGSSAFWAVAIVFTVIAFSFFLRERKISLNKDSWRHFWTAVTQWWRSLWQNMSRQIAVTRQAINTRRQQQPDNILNRLRPRRFIRLGTLSPRDQLRYFYLTTVERAGQRGVARQQSETPLEFAQDLKDNWPDAEVDVEKLTDAFLQARYSPQPIDAEQVNPIKAHWKHLRSRLRRRQE